MRARRGCFIAIVGPDGVGKTTLADRLLDQVEEPAGYVHFRPAVLKPLPPRPLNLRATSRDKNPPSNRALGWLRLGLSVLRFWAGYLVRMMPLLQRGGTIIADRWAYGYVAQPRALRFLGPARLARWVIRLVPSPDVVVNLVAPPALIASRKAELTEEEISKELRLWASLPVHSMKTMDATLAPEVLATRLLSELQTIE